MCIFNNSYLKVNLIPIIILISSLIYISKNILFSLLYFWLFFFMIHRVHLSVHQENSIWGPLNILHLLHHRCSKSMIAAICEFIFETGGICLFSKVYSEIAPSDHYVTVFLACLYISVHNINYTFFHTSPEHERHHTNTKYGYAPDFIDMMVGTKNPLDKGPENYMTAIPNIILSTIVVIILKRCKNYNHIFANIFNVFNIFLLILFNAIVYYDNLLNIISLHQTHL